MLIHTLGILNINPSNTAFLQLARRTDGLKPLISEELAQPHQPRKGGSHRKSLALDSLRPFKIKKKPSKEKGRR